MSEDDELTIDMGVQNEKQSEPGDVETGVIQQLRRVSIPIEIVDSIDMDVGDKVFILNKGDGVYITNDFDSIQEERDGIE